MPDKTINVTVLVDEKHRADLAKVARELKKHGFRLAVSHDEIGVLSGSVDKTAEARLEGVQGVSKRNGTTIARRSDRRPSRLPTVYPT